VRKKHVTLSKILNVEKETGVSFVKVVELFGITKQTVSVLCHRILTVVLMHVSSLDYHVFSPR
jgi:hypothetical protein